MQKVEETKDAKRLREMAPNRLPAMLLFSEAKARLEEIFSLTKEFNEISDGLRALGYGADENDFSTNPMPNIELSTGSMTLSDVSILDELFLEGPQFRKVKVISKRQVRISLESERDRLGEASGWICFYCGARGDSNLGPDDRRWHVDHVYPVCLGGDDKQDNHVLACASCNLSKSASSALGHFRYLEQ